MSEVKVNKVSPRTGTDVTLGGKLDTNDNNIITSSNRDLNLYPNGTGAVEIGGNTNPGTIILNCESNSHGVKIQSPAHSSAQSYTMKLPATNITAGKFLKVDSITGSGATAVGQLSFADAGGGYVYKIDNQINNTRAVISASGSKTTLISGTFTNTVASSKVLVQLKMPNYGTADGAMGIGFTYNGTDYDGAITQSQEDTDQVSFSMMNKGFTNPASTGSINWVIYFKTAGGASKRPFKTVNPNTTDDADLPQQETQITFTEYTA